MCSWHSWTVLQRHTDNILDPTAALYWLPRAEKCPQLGTSTLKDHQVPQKDILTATASFCSCTCLPRFFHSPRQSCLFSKLAGFNPSSSVSAWKLKMYYKQIVVYNIIIANISALFSTQRGEVWNERRADACQRVKFYGLMSQNYSFWLSQLVATLMLWMLSKTKEISK